jgi:Right handed beta helix region
MILPRSMVVLAVAALVGGCATRRNPDFCCSSADACSAHGASDLVTCADPMLVCDDQHDVCVDPTHGGDCTTPADCPQVTPYCVNLTCVQCEGTMGCSASAPVCGADNGCGVCTAEADCMPYDTTPHCGADGACVRCRDNADCPAGQPVCDGGSCRLCQADTDCDSGACDLHSGACLAEAETLYVAKGQSGDCTKASPCGAIATAIGMVTSQKKYIHVAAATYAESITVSNKTVTILGGGATVSPSTIGAAGFVVADDSDLTIMDLTVSNAVGSANADGVRCSLGTGSGNPKLTIRWSSLADNAGQGVDASSCDVTVEETRILHNTGGGLNVTSADHFSLVNDVIALNGDPQSNLGGLLITGSSVGNTIAFNTIADNTAMTGHVPGVQCAVGTVATPNNIVFGNGAGAQVTGDCVWTYSDIGPTAENGTGNFNMAPLFKSPSTRDYGLMAASPVRDLADPGAVLDIDFQGETRPQGTAREPGADEIP